MAEPESRDEGKESENWEEIEKFRGQVLVKTVLTHSSKTQNLYEVKTNSFCERAVQLTYYHVLI